MANENSGDGTFPDYDLAAFNSNWENAVDDSSFVDEQTFNLFLNGVGSIQEVPINDASVFNSLEIIPAGPSHELMNIIKDESIDADSAVSVSSTLQAKPASLPASQNWSGEYNFQIFFNPPQKKTKGVTWTYISEKKKLYVGKEAACPINFSTEYLMPEGVQIRATALFSSPDSASEVVQRCINHSGEDMGKGISEPEHLVRCGASGVRYETDPITKRHSVIIPFENPPPGQTFSTYIFKFCCFGSCPSPGPNRRPLMLIFALEKDNQVIGRQKVDVKICACPGRDSKTEEESISSGKKRKKRSEPESSRHLTSSVQLLSKKSKKVLDQDGNYNITVKDRKCFEFLTQMQKYYNIVKTMKNMPPDVKRLLDQYQQRKGYRLPQDLTLSD